MTSHSDPSRESPQPLTYYPSWMANVTATYNLTVYHQSEVTSIVTQPHGDQEQIRYTTSEPVDLRLVKDVTRQYIDINTNEEETDDATMLRF